MRWPSSTLLLLATPNDITVFTLYTLLPTCWIFTNTDFHIGLRSFLITSVLQIGIWTPPSATFDINKKGSYKIKKKHIIAEWALLIMQKRKRTQVHTFLEKRSLHSKSEHLNAISIAVFELTHSSACTRSFPQFLGSVDLKESSVCRSIVND